MIKLKKDVALIARPDHSYFIYEELQQSRLSFIYVTFKLCPQWIGRLFRIQRIRWAKRNCYQSFLMTLHNIAIYNFNWEWLEKYNEGKIFTRYIAKVLNRYDIKLIHYWPDYCIDYMSDYKQKHPAVITLADIYFPCAETIIKEVEPVLRKYGLEDNLNYLKEKIEFDRHIMAMETDFMVPSPYVADTYKAVFPNKNFHVVSYGIKKWEGYKKKSVPSKIFRFVYVGTISVEKGVDFLCEWFCNHPEYEVHLIGKYHPKEVFIFEKYKSMSNIVFEGVIPKNEIQKTVSQFDIGIHMSRYDAYSIAVSEVISAGLPVVVSIKTGIFFDISTYGLGKVVPFSNDELKSAVDEIIDNYQSYLDNIESYMKSIDYNYPSEMVKKYEKLLGKDS